MDEKLHLPTLIRVIEGINKQIEFQLTCIANAKDDKWDIERGELIGLRTTASRVNCLILEAGGKEVQVN